MEGPRESGGGSYPLLRHCADAGAGELARRHPRLVRVRTDGFDPVAAIEIALAFGLGAVLLLFLRCGGRLHAYAAMWRKTPVLLLFTAFALLSIAWSISPTVTLYKWTMFALATLAGSYLGFRFSARGILEVLFWYGAIVLILSAAMALIVPPAGRMFPPIDNAWRGIFWHKNHLGTLVALLSLVYLYRLADDYYRRRTLMLVDGFFYASADPRRLAESLCDRPGGAARRKFTCRPGVCVAAHPYGCEVDPLRGGVHPGRRGTRHSCPALQRPVGDAGQGCNPDRADPHVAIGAGGFRLPAPGLGLWHGSVLELSIQSTCRPTGSGLGLARGHRGQRLVRCAAQPGRGGVGGLCPPAADNMLSRRGEAAAGSRVRRHAALVFLLSACLANVAFSLFFEIESGVWLLAATFLFLQSARDEVL